jgi:hypothetical protein
MSSSAPYTLTQRTVLDEAARCRSRALQVQGRLEVVGEAHLRASGHSAPARLASNQCARYLLLRPGLGTWEKPTCARAGHTQRLPALALSLCARGLLLPPAVTLPITSSAWHISAPSTSSAAAAPRSCRRATSRAVTSSTAAKLRLRCPGALSDALRRSAAVQAQPPAPRPGLLATRLVRRAHIQHHERSLLAATLPPSSDDETHTATSMRSETAAAQARQRKQSPARPGRRLMLSVLKAGATPRRMPRHSGSLALAEIMLGCGGSLVPCARALAGHRRHPAVLTPKGAASGAAGGPQQAPDRSCCTTDMAALLGSSLERRAHVRPGCTARQAGGRERKACRPRGRARSKQS